LVADGKVRVSRFASGGRCTVIDIYTPSQFFGESLLVSLPFSSEQAIALENTRLISWTELELDQIVSRQPQVASGLIRAMAERIVSLSDRIESLCTENTERRIAKALLRFANRMGKPERDGSTRMLPLTHEFLAQYVGTSREMVTLYMNHLRRGDYISYSRQGTTLKRDAVSEWLLGNKPKKI